MRRLIVIPDNPTAMTLLEALRDASINAILTHESRHGQIHGGMRHAVIWIDDDADLDLAIGIQNQILAETTFATCPRCGYDLRAHHGTTRCPECGRALTAPTPEINCPHCGEPNPANFDLCWNCAKPLTPDASPPPPV